MLPPRAIPALGAASALGAAPPAPPYAPPPGPYTTAHDIIAELPGMTSNESVADAAACITYPTSGPTNTSFPLLVFGHGANHDGPDDVCAAFRPLLETVASYGFTIVSPTSCRFGDFTHDMLRAAEGCIRDRTLHPALAAADFSRTGFFGQSNGATCTQMLAGDAANVRKYNIKAAVAEHAGCPGLGGACRDYGPTGSNVPFMYVSMSGDTVATPAGSTNGYNLAGDGDKVLWMGEGGAHWEPTTRGGNKEDQPVALFFACHVRGERCDEVYGHGGDAICKQNFTMHQCATHRAGAPTGTPAPYTTPTPPPAPPLPPLPPVPTACAAALAAACAYERPDPRLCSFCVARNEAALKAAGCRIVLGTHDDTWSWCNGQNGTEPLRLRAP